VQRKAFPIKSLKADSTEGEFSAVVSVFGNVDLGGDVVEPGAFKRTLEERGMPPVVYSHQWDSAPIGVVTEAEETKEGLQVEARLFVDDNPDARAVYAALRGGALKEFSFAYGVKDFRIETNDDEEEVRYLSDVDLFEVGPTLVGMNPDTRLVEVRSVVEAVLEEKEGRRNSGTDSDRLQTIHDLSVDNGAKCETQDVDGGDEGKAGALCELLLTIPRH